MHSQFTAFTFPLRTITILIFRIFTSFLFYGVVPTMHASLNIVVWFCLFSGTSSKQQKRNISYFFCVWLLAFSFMLCNFLMWYIAVVHSCSLLCNIAWYECSLIHSSIPCWWTSSTFQCEAILHMLLWTSQHMIFATITCILGICS